MSEPREPRRRRGRGIDAIFDSTDLDLGPAAPPDPKPSDADKPATVQEAPTAERLPGRAEPRPDEPIDPHFGEEIPDAAPGVSRVGAYGDEPRDGRVGGEGGSVPRRRSTTGATVGAHARTATPGDTARAPSVSEPPARERVTREVAPGEPRGGRSAGRPPSNRPPGRELVQRGFYLEVEQDRTLDETKAALKSRGFTPDRSAIVRAALEHFARLDRLDQEELVRREK